MTMKGKRMMSVGDIIAFMRDNPDMSILQVSRAVGAPRKLIERIAANITFPPAPPVSRKKDYCKGRPHSCFNCPYEDCILGADKSPAETAFEPEINRGEYDDK